MTRRLVSESSIVISILALLCISSTQNLSKNTILPLRQVGKLFLIEATVDGQVGNFVFDTGATNLVLNQTYFRKLSGQTNIAGGISGRHAIIKSSHIDHFEIGDISFEDLRVDIANLGSIENQRGVKIMGLLGMSIFRNLELQVDLRNQKLILKPTDRKGNLIYADNDTYQPDDDELTLKVVQRNGIMFIPASVGGKRLDFCLDTGAESNVLCSTCRKDILSTVTINRRTTLTGVGGNQIEVLYGRMNQFEVAEAAFNQMNAIITNLTALSEAYGYPVGGVLGYDFFEKGVFRINLAKKEIVISLHQK